VLVLCRGYALGVDQQAGLRDTMTSESDSTSGRRPPTIELTATEVEPPKAPQDTAGETAKADKAGQETSEPKPAAPTRSRLLLHGISAAIGAVAAAVVLIGLWLAGFTLARDVVTSETEGPQAVVPIAANSEVTARLDKIEHALAAPKPETPAMPPALANRLSAVEMQAKMLGDSAATLNHRVDDIAAATQAAQKQATSAASTAADAKSAGQTSIQPADLEKLASRIAALESAVKSLSEQVAHPAAGIDQAARLTVAAQALRTAVASGTPYQAELKAMLALGADQSAAAPLDAFAATGVPPRDMLARELAALVPSLRQAAGSSSGATTFLDKLKANAEKLVEFTPAEPPPGNDPASVITRLDIDADRADIGSALSDIAALPDHAKSLAADWAKKAQAREAAIAASQNIAADALSSLSKPAAQ
jgi:hypothetical protein